MSNANVIGWGAGGDITPTRIELLTMFAILSDLPTRGRSAMYLKRRSTLEAFFLGRIGAMHFDIGDARTRRTFGAHREKGFDGFGRA